MRVSITFTTEQCSLNDSLKSICVALLYIRLYLKRLGKTPPPPPEDIDKAHLPAGCDLRVIIDIEGVATFY